MYMCMCVHVCVCIPAHTLQEKKLLIRISTGQGPSASQQGLGHHPRGAGPTSSSPWAAQAFPSPCRQPPPITGSKPAVSHPRARTCLSKDLSLPEASL